MTEGIVFYRGRERIGKIYTSRTCFIKKQQYKIPDEILQEAFRFGREIESGKLAYPDGDRLIIVIYAEGPVRTGIFRGNLENIVYVLITCWVQKILRKEVNKNG